MAYSMGTRDNPAPSENLMTMNRFQQIGAILNADIRDLPWIYTVGRYYGLRCKVATDTLEGMAYAAKNRSASYYARCRAAGYIVLHG